MRPHWALHELSLLYETRPIRSRTGTTSDASFTALNTRQKIPILEDGEVVLGESAAIITYLSDRYSNGRASLTPPNPSDRARATEWCFFIMTELDATSLYVLRRHHDLANIYGDAPAAVQSARGYFAKQLTYVDRVLGSGRQYLMGEQFTTADILLTTCLTWAVELKISLHDSCDAYLQRTTMREAYRRAYATNHMTT